MTGLEWRIRWNWDWPLWLSVLMTISVVAWVAALYFREASSAGKPMRTLLALLRLAALTLVVAMLAQPAIEWFRTGRPRLVVLVDRSASMATRDQPSVDGDQSRLAALKSFLNQSFLKTWQSTYDLDLVALDEQTVRVETLQSLTTSEESIGTCLGDAIDYALRELPGPTPSAIVLFTDGISTRGQSLEKGAQRARALQVPLYPVAVGNPQKRPDVAIDNFLAEEVVFPGDRLQVEAMLRATGYADQEALITLRNTTDDQILAQSTIQLPAEEVSQIVRLATRLETPGQLALQLEIKPLEGETNVENNVVSQTVEVRDEKIRVLLAQASPSYEYRALKSLLERDPAVELRVHLQEADADFSEVDPIALAEFPSLQQERFPFDVVLLGDIDPALLPRQTWATLLRLVSEQGGGLACIAGPRFMPQAFQDSQPLRVLLPFELETTSRQSTEPYSIQPTALGWQMPSLQLGETDAESRAIWQSFPPVSWGFAIEKIKPGAQVLAEHATRNRLPMILRHYVGRGEVWFHATDETWRWRWRTDDRYFARYWGQVVRRLGRRRLATKQEIHLTTDRTLYRLGEDIKLRLRFRSPVNNRAAIVQLQSAKNPEQEIRLHRHPTHRSFFETVLQGLSPGKYKATLPDEAASTTFEIKPPPRELSRLAADHPALIEAAKISGGKFYTLETVSELLDDLPPPRRTTIEQLPPRPLWNTHAAMALLVSVLTAEWLLRRRHGML
ncbi:MAG: VWA domain-containing protein [Planctomycetes bacterium]|nr:VWA domain-containing protein [Planctomycetota bacterium]